MLLFTGEQVELLCASARERFHECVAGLLREAYPQHTRGMKARELNALVAAAVERSHALGFRTDAAVGDFVSLWLQLGADFDRHAKVVAVLDDTTIEPEARLGVLMDRLSASDWQEVHTR